MKLIHESPSSKATLSALCICINKFANMGYFATILIRPYSEREAFTFPLVFSAATPMILGAVFSHGLLQLPE